jgi:L-2,4-diaminobutyrate decarboxylase
MDPLERVRRAYDPDLFRTRAHALVDEVADYLKLATSGQLPVLPWKDPREQVAAWPATFPSGASFAEIMGRVVGESHHLHHPRYVGHQVTAPLPEAALADLVSALLNNGTAIYEMGPVSTAMERALARFLTSAVGFPDGADAIFTSGGSAGNLTALAAARQAKAGFDAWSLGATKGPPLAYLVSTETHYSVARALALMGLGERGAMPVPVDARFRLRPEALDQAKRDAEAHGRKVVAVVASAGSTATGAFDPLDAVADFCAAHDLWLHVDGAHGATTVLSPTHRARLHGIARADSITWDAHKMMLVPALVTGVLFRDGRRSYQAFAQEASYLFDGRPLEEEWFNGANRTLECTKVMMALKWYLALALHGPAFFADYVDGMFALASRFADRIASSPDFELAVRPDCNIVCFRHVRAGLSGARLDELQDSARAALVREGAFYLVKTRLPSGLFLRVTIINPFTRDQELADLLDAVRARASRQLEGGSG